VATAGNPSEDDATYPGPSDGRAQWLPDPFGRYALRYFDGIQWTQHVSKVDRSVTTDRAEHPPPKSNEAEVSAVSPKLEVAPEPAAARSPGPPTTDRAPSGPDLLAMFTATDPELESDMRSPRDRCIGAAKGIGRTYFDTSAPGVVHELAVHAARAKYLRWNIASLTASDCDQTCRDLKLTGSGIRSMAARAASKAFGESSSDTLLDYADTQERAYRSMQLAVVEANPDKFSTEPQFDNWLTAVAYALSFGEPIDGVADAPDEGDFANRLTEAREAVRSCHENGHSARMLMTAHNQANWNYSVSKLERQLRKGRPPPQFTSALSAHQSHFANQIRPACIVARRLDWDLLAELEIGVRTF